jgi:hypothetical protein
VRLSGQDYQLHAAVTIKKQSLVRMTKQRKQRSKFLFDILVKRLLPDHPQLIGCDKHPSEKFCH